MNRIQKYRKTVVSNTAYQGYRNMLYNIKILGILLAISLFLAGLFNGFPEMIESFRAGLNTIIEQAIYAAIVWLVGDFINSTGNVIADIADSILESHSRDFKE
jgi:hypothetical protein